MRLTKLKGGLTKVWKWHPHLGTDTKEMENWKTKWKTTNWSMPTSLVSTDSTATCWRSPPGFLLSTPPDGAGAVSTTQNLPNCGFHISLHLLVPTFPLYKSIISHHLNDTVIIPWDVSAVFTLQCSSRREQQVQIESQHLKLVLLLILMFHKLDIIVF